MRAEGKGERGQSLVELALLAPVLIFGLIAAADLARAYSAQLAIQNASRAGAEAAVLHVATTDALIESYALEELASAPGLDPDDATVTITHSTSGGVSFVTVRVQYTWSTLVAWPLVPNQASFDRSTVMREYD